MLSPPIWLYVSTAAFYSPSIQALNYKGVIAGVLSAIVIVRILLIALAIRIVGRRRAKRVDREGVTECEGDCYSSRGHHANTTPIFDSHAVAVNRDLDILSQYSWMLSNLQWTSVGQKFILSHYTLRSHSQLMRQPNDAPVTGHHSSKQKPETKIAGRTSFYCVLRQELLVSNDLVQYVVNHNLTSNWISFSSDRKSERSVLFIGTYETWSI